MLSMPSVDTCHNLKHAPGCSTRSLSEFSTRNGSMNFFPHSLHTFVNWEFGVLLISPAIGSEGRIVRIGDQTVIAVGTSSSLSPAAPLYEAVRELCFPLVNRVSGVTTGSMSRSAAIDAANHAAVRCGAMLLDVSSTTMGAEYRETYLGSMSNRGNVSREFDARFPLSKPVEKSLRDEVERVMSDRRSTRR